MNIGLVAIRFDLFFFPMDNMLSIVCLASRCIVMSFSLRNLVNSLGLGKWIYYAWVTIRVTTFFRA